jgi:hypothetical protein
MNQTTNSKPPVAAPADPMAPVTAMVARLRAAVVTISGKSPTTARTVLDRYYRYMAPTAAAGADAHSFPTPVRRHAHNPEAGTIGGKFNLVCFYVGNALLAYYDSVRAKAVTPEFARRVLMVEMIAKHELINFKIVGTPQDGLTLDNPLANLTLKAWDKQHALPPATTA